MTDANLVGMSVADDHNVDIECIQHCKNTNVIRMNRNILNELLGQTCQDNSNITTKLESRCKAEFLSNTTLSNEVRLLEL